MRMKRSAEFGLGGAIFAALLIVSAPVQSAGIPNCSSLPAPFPCGQGTHQVCTKNVRCNFGGTGGVPQKIRSTCTEAKCVKTPTPIGTAAPAAQRKKPNQLNPQPEPPGRTR